MLLDRILPSLQFEMFGGRAGPVGEYCKTHLLFGSFSIFEVLIKVQKSTVTRSLNLLQ